MPYKKSTATEFKGKGFIDLDSQQFISSDKKDAGMAYNLGDIFSNIAGNGAEIQWSIKQSDVSESIEAPVEEE